MGQVLHNFHTDCVLARINPVQELNSPHVPQQNLCSLYQGIENTNNMYHYYTLDSQRTTFDSKDTTSNVQHFQPDTMEQQIGDTSVV